MATNASPGGDAKGTLTSHGSPRRLSSRLAPGAAAVVSQRSIAGRIGTFAEFLEELADAETGDEVRQALTEAGSLTKDTVHRAINQLLAIQQELERRPDHNATKRTQFESPKPALEDVSQTKNHEILVFGGIAMDMIGEVDHFPTPNSTLEASDFRTAPGGKGANEAVACGALGSTCYAFGRVGDDDFGRTMLKRLSAFVNVDGVLVDPSESTGFALIVTASDTRQKTNTICKGANENVGEKDLRRLEDNLDKHPGIGIMLLTLDAGDHDNGIMAEAASIGQAKRKLVVLRASPISQARGIVPKLCDNSNVIIVTETEASLALQALQSAPTLKTGRRSSMIETRALHTLQQCADAARQLLACSSTLVAVIVSSPMGVCCRLNLPRMGKIPWARNLMFSDSPAGSSGITEDDEYTIVLPCFRGPVVDVVGAVDALTGGIAAALSQGVPLSHALVWGTACCAQSISEHGAQESMPSMEQLQGFFRMEKIRVATGKTLGPKEWPIQKPAVESQIRDLEELMHAGEHVKFENALSAWYQQSSESSEADRSTSGLDIAVDFQGHTLLHIATLYCDLTFVLLLLSHGASIFVQDFYGKTVLDRCSIELEAARHAKKKKFALIKFCVLCVHQVNAVISKFKSSPRFFDSRRQSVPVLPSIEALDSMLAETVISDPSCDTLTSYLTQGWSYSLLSLMTLPIEESSYCREFRSEMHALSNFLLMKLLDDEVPDLREHAVKFMQVTVLESLSISYAHGLAYSGNNDVIQALQGNPISLIPLEDSLDHDDGQTDIQDSGNKREHPSQDSENARIEDAGWRYVHDNMQQSCCTDSEERGLLHYAVMGENDDMCCALLNWGHDMYARDAHGKTPMAYAETSVFADHVKKLQLVTDAFVSIGHTTATDKTVALLVDEAKNAQLKLWWDKGGENDGPGIRSGQPWTAEIERAMKKCKICVVMLTRRWLDSKYCHVEALCALSYNKLIISVMPPVPKSEQVSIDEIPEGALKDAVTARQVFDFSTLSTEEYIASLPKVFEVIRTIGRSFSRSAAIEVPEMESDTTTRITEIFKPHTSEYRWHTDKHVFIVCGSPADNEGKTAFARLLAKQLVASGVPVSLGFMPSDKHKDPEYPHMLRKRIESCDFMAIVLEEVSDLEFLNMVAQIVCTSDTKLVVVPYMQMSEAQVGFGYTAHLASPNTCCFTDWMGTGVGLLEASSIFQEGFDDFLVKLDGLHEEISRAEVNPRIASLKSWSE